MPKLIEKCINFAEIWEIYKFAQNYRRKCLYFVEIEGEYAICIIGLGEWTPMVINILMSG